MMNFHTNISTFACIYLFLVFILSGCSNGADYSYTGKTDPSNLSENKTANVSHRDTCCFDLFVNVCNSSLNNEHFVGKGTVKVYNREGDRLLWEDKDGFDEGKIATICFDYNPDDQSDAYYIEIMLNNSFLNTPVKYAGIVPVTELLKFKTLPQWDTSMNALHVQLCPGKDSCILGQYICNTTK